MVYYADKKVSKKRSVIDIRTKPKRPLSAYNIFYRLSRKLLISSISKDGDTITFVDSTFDSISSMEKSLLLEITLEITKQHRSKIAGKVKLINHLKPLGILGFKDLNRIIAAQWTKLAQSTKMIFEACSVKDKKIYTDLRNTWKSEKDAKIREKLNEQLLCEDSGLLSSEGFEDYLTQIQSISSSASITNDKILHHVSPPLCYKQVPPTASMSSLARLVSNEESSILVKNPQIHSHEPNACMNKTCSPVRSGQLQSSRRRHSKVRQNLFSNDLKSNSCPLEANQTEFLVLRTNLLNDVFEDENLHDLFISLLK